MHNLFSFFFKSVKNIGQHFSVSKNDIHEYHFSCQGGQFNVGQYCILKLAALCVLPRSQIFLGLAPKHDTLKYIIIIISYDSSHLILKACDCVQHIVFSEIF